MPDTSVVTESIHNAEIPCRNVLWNKDLQEKLVASTWTSFSAIVITVFTPP